MNSRKLSDCKFYNDTVRRYNAAHQRGYNDYAYAIDRSESYAGSDLIAYQTGRNKRMVDMSWLLFRDAYLKIKKSDT